MPGILKPRLIVGSICRTAIIILSSISLLGTTKRNLRGV